MWLVFHFLLTRRPPAWSERRSSSPPGISAPAAVWSVATSLGRLTAPSTSWRAKSRPDAAAQGHRRASPGATRAGGHDTRLHQILDNTTAVIFVKDKEGRFVFGRQPANHAALSCQPSWASSERPIARSSPKKVAETFRANDRLVLQRNEAVEFRKPFPRTRAAYLI